MLQILSLAPWLDKRLTLHYFLDYIHPASAIFYSATSRTLFSSFIFYFLIDVVVFILSELSRHRFVSTKLSMLMKRGGLEDDNVFSFHSPHNPCMPFLLQQSSPHGISFPFALKTHGAELFPPIQVR